MEILIQIILVLALMKYALKAAMTRHLWSILCYAGVAAIVAIISYPMVIKQPVNIITLLLKHKDWVTDGAVLTTLEAIAGIFASIFLLNDYLQPQKHHRIWSILLRIIPGYLAFFAILFFELLFFRLQISDSFLTTALLYAALLFVGITTLGCVIRYIIRNYSMRLELKVLLNLEILVIGLMVHCSIADYRNSQAIINIDWLAMTGFLCVALLGIGLGYLLRNFSLKSKLYSILKH